MNRIRRWLPQALFESFIMIVSILTALAVNEWRDNRARLTRADEARTVFIHEIEANRALISSEPILPHHQRLQQAYQKLAEANSEQPGPLFETGAHPAPLRDAAWRSFSAGSTLSDFKPEHIVLLSDIYRAQEALEKLNSGFIAQVSAPRSDRETPEYKRDATRSIGMYLNDVVPLEERLLRDYEHATQQLRATVVR